MSRVALVVSESLRPAMGGIGVRYLELARRIAAEGFDTLVLSPGTEDEARAAGLEGVAVRRVESGAIARQLAGRDVVVAQGQLANEVIQSGVRVPVVIDLYDPWLVENFQYLETLGLDPYRNDHSSWILQLSHGDYFLCSSAEQRLFYLGLLTALGRVHPVNVADDPELTRLIGVVPFGCTSEPPPRRPLLPAREPGERRILFGGVYDWYDADTLLAAALRLETPGWTLLVVRNPNPASTPQSAFARLEQRARDAGLWGGRVRAIDWVPADRRFDLLAEVDVLAAPHRRSIESELAYRTRFLDALSVGCPAVATTGGTLSRMLEERHAGWTVSPGDAGALARILDEVLAGGDEVAATVARGRALARELDWDRVLTPLVDFLRAPRVDPTKDRFVSLPSTSAPPDRAAFRVRRWLKRTLVGDDKS